jgi:hypothetical protein
MYSKFEEELPILDGDADLRLGVCAMGPVAATDTITWMRVWVWQVAGKKVAASSGVSGAHPGAHRLGPTEELPFTAAKGWMVQTQLEPGSEQFSEGKPARAMAMALVTNDDGTEEDVLEWSQAVLVRGHRNHEYP